MMTFTGFRGRSSGPVPASAGVVARPGAATASPGAGRVFAAVMGAGGADGSDVPDAPVPDMATGGDGALRVAAAAAPGNGFDADGADGARGLRVRQPESLPSADDAETAIVPAPGNTDAMPSFAVMPQVDAAQRIVTMPPHDVMSADAATPTPTPPPPLPPPAMQPSARLPEQGRESVGSGRPPPDSGAVALPGQGGAPDVRHVAIPPPHVAAVPEGGAAPMEADGNAPGAREVLDTPDASVTSAQPRPFLAAAASAASRPALAVVSNQGPAVQAAAVATALARAIPPQSPPGLATQSPARVPAGSGEEDAGATARTTKAGSAALQGQGTEQEARQIAMSSPRVPTGSDGGGLSQYTGGDRPDAPAQPRQPLVAPTLAPTGRAAPVQPALARQAAVAAQSEAAPPHPGALPLLPFIPAPTLIIPTEGKRSTSIAASSVPKGRLAAARASGPRAASVVPILAVASPPLGAPVQANVFTAFAATMRLATDPAGYVDPTLAAPEHDVSAPQAPSLAPPAPQGAAAQDIPRQIALRIAHAAAGAAGSGRGTIEISLNPEELGRVRLRLHPSDVGLSVTITADRPETLDLMRRHIDLLAREFLEIGYEGAQFDFTQGGPGADADPGAPDLAPASALATQEPNTGPPSQAALLMLGDRLDIRL